MLLGEYDHTLDDKNRLTLPAKFRAAFADGGLVLTRGLDGCLYAYPAAEWEQASSIAPRRPRPAQQGSRRDAALLLFRSRRGRARQAGTGHVPAALAQRAELGRDVVVAGVYDHLEIWDRAAWRAQMNEIEGSAEDVAERLATKRD